MEGNMEKVYCKNCEFLDNLDPKNFWYKYGCYYQELNPFNGLEVLRGDLKDNNDGECKNYQPKILKCKQCGAPINYSVQGEGIPYCKCSKLGQSLYTTLWKRFLKHLKLIKFDPIV